MTKKDYAAIAEILRESELPPNYPTHAHSGGDAVRELITATLTEYFDLDPKFDRTKFIAAARLL